MEIPEADAQLHERFHDAMQNIEKIRSLYKVPSVSVGVLHAGKVVFTQSVGMRDAEQQLPADPDTIYPLGSVSKPFLSAAIGIAVAEDKMGWHQPLSEYLPDFNPSGDPRTKDAPLYEFLRHGSGLGNPQVLVHGPHGILINEEGKFIEMMNDTPTTDSHGQRLSLRWRYNSMAYALPAMALQKACGTRYAEFLKSRILKPLNMDRTAVSKADLENEPNVAYPYAILEDGSTKKLPCNATDERNTPALAAMGIQSSVNDMLRFAAAVLEAEKLEAEAEAEEAEPINSCPGEQPESEKTKPVLQNVLDTRRDYHWPIPTADRFNNDCRYCMGWTSVDMPNAMMGWIGFNSMTRYDDKKTNHGYIIGVESPKRRCVQHSGLINGSSCAFFTFPETQSAVVAFANAVQNGDAADWAASLMTQALFDLHPKVDFLPLARREQELRHEYYARIVNDWREHRDAEARGKMDLSEFIGDYHALATTVSIFHGSDPDQLAVNFNNMDATTRELECYSKDTLSFMPIAHDDYFENCMLDWDYYKVGLFYFGRDEHGAITGFKWTLEQQDEPSFFNKC